jgi:aspartate beta-hydroxylase
MQASLTAAQVQALAHQGMAALRSGHAQPAREALARLVAAGVNNFEVHLALAHACRLAGAREQALVAVDAALALQPRDVMALVFKGDCLDAAAQPTAAAFYQAALRCAEQLQQVPAEWSAALTRAKHMCDRYARHFEETLRTHLATVDPAVGPPSQRFEQSLQLLTGQRLLYPSAPRLYQFPELPTVQFHGREGFPWLARLEAATADIRREALAVLANPQGLAPYVQSDPMRPALRKGGLVDNPDWSAFFLWKNGHQIEEHARRCPATVAALGSLPLVHIARRSPSVLFSVMRPGAHIPAHHGFVNTRLIVHLPLVVPPGCRFRVGNDMREWQEGRAWLFDDTIEHEAWNPSEHTRVILLFEVWRPELSSSERAYVSALFESIEKQRGGVGDWGI